MTGVVTGNTYDKYGSTNPVVKRLMARFERDLDDLFERAGAGGIRSLLDFGCGEGVLTHRWALARPDARVVGVDLDGLQEEWAARTAPNLAFSTERAFADDEFDVVTAIEVLEHVSEPERELADLARIGRRWLIASVPREPLWRALNLARGAYVRDLGNTPGHLNHWSRRAFLDLLGRHGEVVEARAPFPWTMALVRL